jgi:hypothetical protein
MGSLIQVLIRKDGDGNMIAEPFINVFGWLFRINKGSMAITPKQKKNKYYQKRNLK